MPVGQHTTRLAPSPTGALHLGNARTFLVNWAMARQRGWRILLRIEDLDSPRVKQGSDREALEILLWLGIEWDDGPVYQSADLSVYREAMRRLACLGAVYPSAVTRGGTRNGARGTASAGNPEGEAASAPQEGAREAMFPASLRPAVVGPREFDDELENWRLVVADENLEFVDGFAGAQSFNVARIVGDFLVWTRRGVPAYQLAVVVDDARQGVTRIVRGDDLLDSTARQMLVARGLDLGFAPQSWHLPLVRGEDGRRLAKRHGDTRLSRYRAAGVRAERVIGLLAAWCGVVGRGRPEEMSAAEFRAGFDATRMPRESIVMSGEDEQWLHADRCR